MREADFIELVEEILEVSKGTVQATDDIRALGWDSLADISFIAKIDELTGKVVSPEALQACKSVHDLFLLVSPTV